MDQDSLVTVFSSFRAWEADLARAALESAGIDAYVVDENVPRTNWLYTAAIGGVKVRVRANDAAEAVAILGELRAANTPKRRCPGCGSKDIRRGKLPSILLVGSFLLLGVPFLFLAPRYQCRQCGRQWKEGAETDSRP